MALGLAVLLSTLLAGDLPVSTSVHVTGNARTRESTVLDLLPRRPPTIYSDEDLAELERRIGNLEIFDAVHVERRGEVIEVTVREKWTLIPSVEFSSGRTFEDTYALLGLTEYNFLGTADALGVSAYHQQRGWGAYVFYDQHTFRRNRWTLGGYADFSTSDLRFDDGNGWTVNRGEGAFWFTSPPTLSDYVGVRVGGVYAREIVSGATSETHPPDSHAVRSTLAVTFNRYRWRDLVSSGIKGELAAGTGVLVGTTPAQPRHNLRLTSTAALPLATYTVLMMRTSASIGTRGNPNFSALLGSLDGVRGLEDALYRNWAQAYANVELRQAVPLSARWALQGVLFADGAAFEQLEASGDRGAFGTALGFGVGARLVPTWLASIVGRVDLARLVVPDSLWFVQLGLSQYF